MLLAGCASMQPLPAGAVAFGLMGDAPYNASEVERLDRLIEDMNAAPLAFVAHVGDITGGRGPCTDEWFAARKLQFSRLRHPLILLPGDNDWTDCHRTGFDPLERLEHWRKLFCNPAVPFPLEKQEGPYCEHVRWEAGGWLFVALNVQGSNNNLGRTTAMDAEYAQRMRAVLAWIDDSEHAMTERKLAGLVLLMQADPFVRRLRGPSGFKEILEKLRALGAAHPGRIVLVNGDTHIYRNDEPIPSVHRLEVRGSPFVSWLRGAVVDGRLDAAPAEGR